MEYDYNDKAYDDLLEDAKRDDRVGNHDFIVTEVIDGFWPSGDPRRKIKGSLVDIPNARADLTISPPPPPEVVAAERKTWTPQKKKGIASAINIYRQLAQYYSTSPEEIVVGDVFHVKIVKTRIDVDGKGGFLRVAAFLPKNETGAKQITDDDVPF